MSLSRVRTTLVLATLGLVLVIFVPAAQADGGIFGPSVHCHMNDGAFSTCPDASQEWSDIGHLSFVGAEVYTDQGTTAGTPTLFLMYDAVMNHTALSGPEHFDVRFDVLEEGALEHYLVECRAGSFDVFVDGIPSDPEGIECAAGFGPSPTSSFFDVFVELSVPLNVVYSPDIPLFWSASGPPPRQPGQGCRLDSSTGQCVGECTLGTPGCVPATCDAAGQCTPCSPEDPRCQPPPPCEQTPCENEPVSATITDARSDGTTVVVAVPPGGAAPSDFCDREAGGILEELMGLLVAGARNHGQAVEQVAHLSRLAIESLINSGALDKGDAPGLHGCIVSMSAKK